MNTRTFHDRILSNNCEHFCEWCLRGESSSSQVEGLRTRPIVRCLARLIDARFALAEALRQRLHLRFDPALASVCE